MSTLDLSLGALEIGVLLSSVLYGVVTLQGFMYMEGNFKDPIWLRIMVGLVWIFETVHTIIIWVYLYSLTVTHYGKTTTIYDTPWSVGISFPVSAVLGSVVQSFYAHRVRVLSGRFIIPLIAWSGSIIRFVVATFLAAKLISSSTIPGFLTSYEWLVTAHFSLCTAVDVFNTSALCFYLLRTRSGVKSTQKMVDKLVMYTVETGLITSLFGLAILITQLTMHNNFIDFGILVIYPKLFSNTFYTTLNARPSLRRMGSTTTQYRSVVIFAPQTRDPESMEVSPQLSEGRPPRSKPVSPRFSNFGESTNSLRPHSPSRA